MAAPPPVIQDLPPKGGYKPLLWKKTVRPKVSPSGVACFAAFAAWSGAWFYFFWTRFSRTRALDHYETTETGLALQPFLLAETDRHFLKRLWINREEERELMKDVPFWVVGAWYDEPVFFDNSKFIYPLMEEYYVHCHPRDFRRRVYVRFMK